jgi:hypothetical protein
MPARVRLTRPPLVRRVPRAITIARSRARFATRKLPPELPPASFGGRHADPYLDYGRFLTPEGGVLIVYKDLDLRWRFIIARAVMWSAATWFEGYYLSHYSPVESGWLNGLCFLVIAALNLFIVWKPPEVCRSLEIRPDCMVLEGRDVFWLRLMENGLPAFQRDKDGNQVLSGIYGTRHVEYLTARRFDDYDRMPEVFAAHLQQAMQQLWAPVLGLDMDHRNSSPRQRN